MIENKLEDLAGNIGAYAKNEIEIVKLELTSKIASSAGTIYSLFVISLVLLTVTVFAGITAALFLSDYLGGYSFGFLAVTCFFLVVSGILVIFRKKILAYPIRNKIISGLF